MANKDNSETSLGKNKKTTQAKKQLTDVPVQLYYSTS